MDEYLVPNSSFLRLYDEYKKYGSLVIAYDFDNTIYDFHQKGSSYFQVMELLRELKRMNCICICFTANQDVKFVKNYCNAWNIPLDKLNENPDFFKSESRKIYFNALLDDRAGLDSVYRDLSLLVNLIKKENV
jgi:hypothetical protein